MARSAESIGQKWNSSWKQAVPDMKMKFSDGISDMRDNLLDTNTINAMVADYEKALKSNAYSNAVRAAFTVDNMGANYDERLDQIAAADLTQTQQGKVVAMTKVRRHIRDNITDVVAEIEKSGNGIKFAGTYTPKMKRMIVNYALAAVSSQITTRSTVAAMLALLIGNIKPEIEGLIVES